MRNALLAATMMLGIVGVGAFALAQAPAPGMDRNMPAQGGMPMMQGRPGTAPAMPMMQMQAPADATPATRGYMAAMETMHRGMMMTYSGNADRDFVAGMIPHHQGAIDMARVVLEHGSDPAVRAISNAVIRDQAREITEMRAILARMPTR
jgi:uncharacterized protein (DUF305 family)